MSKIDQKYVLRALSVSSLCLCLSLSASSLLAMENREEEEKPPVAAPAASAAAVSPSSPLKEEASAAPLLRSFAPLSEEEQQGAQALLKVLSTLNPPPEQQDLFVLIDRTRQSVEGLLKRIAQPKSPSSSHPSTALVSADASASPAEQSSSSAASAVTTLPLEHETQQLTNEIQASLAALIQRLKYSFGFVRTNFGYDRVSDTFHTVALKELNERAQHYRKEAAHHQEGTPLHQENTALSEFFNNARGPLSNRQKTIQQDGRFTASLKLGWTFTGYYPGKGWEDLVVITLSPLNFHLYVQMMKLLDETYTRLGLLSGGKSLVEGDNGLKYGLYDRNYVGAYLEYLKKMSQDPSVID